MGILTLDLSEGEALLRRLELTVRNRLDGLLQGNYAGLVPGAGSEAGESRPYAAGDDVRRMDWPVTARTTVPHVRQTIADRELSTWLVVDVSASMDFGTARSDKRELALAAITALAHLTVRGGNRLGAVAFDGRSGVRIPARSGRDHARHLVRTIGAMPAPAAAGRPAPPPGGDLAAALHSLARPPQRRGLVAVVSDFLDAPPPDGAASGEPPWLRPLRALSGRQQLLGVEIVDPRELDLPATGLVTFADPETGRQVEVQTSAPQIRQRFAQAAERQRAAVADALRRAGAAHLRLRTDRDWVGDVVRFVLTRRQAVAGAVGIGVR